MNEIEILFASMQKFLLGLDTENDDEPIISAQLSIEFVYVISHGFRKEKYEPIGKLQRLAVNAKELHPFSR